jgi:hypothetical protein
VLCAQEYHKVYKKTAPQYINCCQYIATVLPFNQHKEKLMSHPKSIVLPQDPAARAKYEAEFAAGKAIGCIPELTGSGQNDQYVCSCGWKSQPYDDGVDLAHTEWLKHIKSMSAII